MATIRPSIRTSLWHVSERALGMVAALAMRPEDRLAVVRSTRIKHPVVLNVSTSVLYLDPFARLQDILIAGAMFRHAHQYDESQPEQVDGWWRQEVTRLSHRFPRLAALLAQAVVPQFTHEVEFTSLDLSGGVGGGLEMAPAGSSGEGISEDWVRIAELVASGQCPTEEFRPVPEIGRFVRMPITLHPVVESPEVAESGGIEAMLHRAFEAPRPIEELAEGIARCIRDRWRDRRMTRRPSQADRSGSELSMDAIHEVVAARLGGVPLHPRPVFRDPAARSLQERNILVAEENLHAFGMDLNSLRTRMDGLNDVWLSRVVVVAYLKACERLGFPSLVLAYLDRHIAGRYVHVPIMIKEVDEPWHACWGRLFAAFRLARSTSLPGEPIHLDALQFDELSILARRAAAVRPRVKTLHLAYFGAEPRPDYDSDEIIDRRWQSMNRSAALAVDPLGIDLAGGVYLDKSFRRFLGSSDRLAKLLSKEG